MEIFQHTGPEEGLYALLDWVGGDKEKVWGYKSRGEPPLFSLLKPGKEWDFRIPLWIK